MQLTGTVEAIDKASRRVLVQGPDRTILYRVSDEVRNFDQVEVGDTITLNYVETVAVAMADPDDTGEPLVDIFGARAEEGQRPGALGATIGTVVVDFIDYDPRTHIARVRTPDGEVLSVTVAEELRRFASTGLAGDKSSSPSKKPSRSTSRPLSNVRSTMRGDGARPAVRCAAHCPIPAWRLA